MIYNEWENKHWKTNKKAWIHPLHGMCSYLAMFPPSLPNYFIKQFTKQGDVVFDPFSGRGTTVIEACLNGRIGIGNDLSPLAYTLTSAKVNLPIKEDVLNRIYELESSYTYTDISNVNEDIKFLYDNEVTLPQLQFLKENLYNENNVDMFITATILGILHGRPRKDGTSLYLSSNMPNTFAMSPNYLKKYKAENNILCPKQNVFQALRYKVNMMYNRKNEYYNKGKSFSCDAQEVGLSKELFMDEQVDLIFTSPPYLKVINYGTYNWIRIWFLNKDIRSIDEKLKLKNVSNLNKEYGLSDNLKINDYLEFMKNVVCSLERILKPNGVAIFVIGDVANYYGRYIKLGEEVWNYIKNYTNLNLYKILEEQIDSADKVTKIWGNSKGRATKVERILILTKGEMRKPNFYTLEEIKKEFHYFF